MPRFYNPDTKTEALEGIHDIENCTLESDMPEESREWFTRAARDGYQWQNDATGTYPVEVRIPEPTREELSAKERKWVWEQLKATDPTLLSDSPYSDSDKQKIKRYRKKLRNPQREKANGFPQESWRPVWPDGVKRPGV